MRNQEDLFGNVNSGPRVLNKYKSGVPKGSVYIGRGSLYGNPYQIDARGGETRAKVIEKYFEYLKSKPELIAKIKTELRGKDLVCYCKPKPCHGDILLKIANE